MNGLELDRRAMLRGCGVAASALCAMPVAAQKPSPASGLDALARAKGMRFGSAVGADDLDDPKLSDLIRNDCSILVGENAFKWRVVEPRPRKYAFGRADRIDAWAADNGMALRGHTMVWNQDNRIPEWLKRVEDEAAEVRLPVLENLVRTHIETMMKRYPRITSWDVVNEVIQLGDGSVRSSVFSRILGDRLMDFTYGIAHEVQPDCQLVYNDYMTWDRKPDHRAGVLRLLEGALGRGVPIDALGIQAHLVNTLHADTDEAAWRSFLDEIRGMGLKVLITELDCADTNVAASSIAERDRAVADHVKAYLDITLSYDNVTDVLLWDMTDRDSYVRSSRYTEKRPRDDGAALRAHPYDENLQRKPMYGAIRDAIAAAPAR